MNKKAPSVITDDGNATEEVTKVADSHLGQEVADSSISRSAWAIHEYLKDSIAMLCDWEDRTSGPRRSAE